MSTLKPYSLAEISAMLDNAERELAAGLGVPDEEAWKEFDESECQIAAGKILSIRRTHLAKLLEA